ncbi:MAG: hypothetical protein INQ03_22915 [Candidatus Heimdallarchaeota archaeon]|nr:hypothetical protein [Candidatus Heimdallarchaeota archaeon]
MMIFKTRAQKPKWLNIKNDRYFELQNIINIIKLEYELLGVQIKGDLCNQWNDEKKILYIKYFVPESISGLQPLNIIFEQNVSTIIPSHFFSLQLNKITIESPIKIHKLELPQKINYFSLKSITILGEFDINCFTDLIQLSNLTSIKIKSKNSILDFTSFENSSIKNISDLFITSNKFSNDYLLYCVLNMPLLSSLFITSPITDIPADIINCKHLRVCHIKSAFIDIMPDFLLKMPKMEYLSLNDIDFLPIKLRDPRFFSK